MDTIGIGVELSHDGNIVKPTSKEQKSVPVGQEYLNETSATVENRYISSDISTLKFGGIDRVRN